MPLPEGFDELPVEDVRDLAPRALEALEAIAEPGRSELAELWAEGYPEPLSVRLRALRERLGDRASMKG